MIKDFSGIYVKNECVALVELVRHGLHNRMRPDASVVPPLAFLTKRKE